MLAQTSMRETSVSRPSCGLTRQRLESGPYPSGKLALDLLMSLPISTWSSTRSGVQQTGKVANVVQTDGHAESLEQVEQRFRRWRESRKQGQRIPAVLWAAAVGMARQHGVHWVARELHLDYNGLKNPVGPVGLARRAAKIDAQFVELFAGQRPKRQPFASAPWSWRTRAG